MPKEDKIGLLRFEERYVTRVWGGQKLRTLFGKELPPNKRIGEAWLISDHPQCESRVAEGPHRGRTLHELVQVHTQAILGIRSALTAHGRFPLLLKLLDTADILSVQVHPDDECAARLGEQDSGKTEMWYVLHGEPHSKLICGLQPDVTPEIFRAAVREQRLEDILRQVEVHQGTAVLIPSGSVHSIGPGLVLAEIQQSSDLTYRIYDWGRPTTDQNSRELHLEKALQTIHFGAEPPKPITPSTAPENRRRHSLLATCPFFTAELITLQGQGRAECSTLGESFHIVLAVSGRLAFATSNDKKQLCPAQALLIPASAQEFVAEGEGSFLDYYVGDTE